MIIGQRVDVDVNIRHAGHTRHCLCVSRPACDCYRRDALWGTNGAAPTIGVLAEAKVDRWNNGKYQTPSAHYSQPRNPPTQTGGTLQGRPHTSPDTSPPTNFHADVRLACHCTRIASSCVTNLSNTTSWLIDGELRILTMNAGGQFFFLWRTSSDRVFCLPLR